MTYAEKLKDPRWQKKRLEILQRDDFVCQYCGSEKVTLHVHHFIYNGNPWEASNDDLITVCEDCHYLIEINNDSYVTKIMRKSVGSGWHFLVAYISDELPLINIYRKENDEWRFCGTIGGISYSFIRKHFEGSYPVLPYDSGQSESE